MTTITYTYPTYPYHAFDQLSQTNAMRLSVGKELAKWQDAIRTLETHSGYFCTMLNFENEVKVENLARTPIIHQALLKSDGFGRVTVFDRMINEIPEESIMGRKFAEIFRGAPAKMYYVEILSESDLKMKNPRPQISNEGIVGFFKNNPYQDLSAIEWYYASKCSVGNSDHPKATLDFIENARRFCDLFNLLGIPSIQTAFRSYSPQKIHNAIRANKDEFLGRLAVVKSVITIEKLETKDTIYNHIQDARMDGML